jgi:hypothetical protein
MLNFQTILNKYGNSFVKKLKEYHIKAGQKASGQTLNEFQFEAIDTTLKVFGADHVEYLDRGRGAGGVAPSSVIYKWSIDKGINFESESKRRSFAFLVARKIAEQGTLQHRTGKTYAGFSKPVSSVFSEEEMKKLTNEISTQMLENSKLEINKIFEKWQSKS